MRTVVVGASSGLGRSIGIGLAKRGRAGRAASRLAQGKPRGRGEARRATHVRDANATSPTARRADPRSPRPRPDSAGSTPSCTRKASGPLAPASPTPTPRRGGVSSTRTSPAPRSSRSAAIDDLTRVERRRRLPVVGQRVTHAAVARPRRVHREQGRARQARRGVAGGAPGHRIHAARRRRLRRRRRRRAEVAKFPNSSGTWSSRWSCIRSGRAQLPERFAHRGGAPHRRRRRRAAAAERPSRSRPITVAPCPPVPS